MEQAKKDPCLASGKFYALSNNITGPQAKAIAGGRNYVTGQDVSDSQQGFMDIVLMAAPLGVSRKVVGGALYNLFRPGSFLNRGEYFRIGFNRFESNCVFRASGEWIEKLFGKGHIFNWEIGPKNANLKNFLRGF